MKKKQVTVTTRTASKVSAAPSGVVQTSSPASKGSKVTTPLPGTILDVFCKPGDAVKAGQRLFLLEAMKMENNIDAEKDGAEISALKRESLLI